jgi:hypothetical protein
MKARIEGGLVFAHMDDGFQHSHFLKFDRSVVNSLGVSRLQ